MCNTPYFFNVQVLALDPALVSWIPEDLHPPQHKLIDWDSPFSTYPRKFICRSPPVLKPNTFAYVYMRIGYMQDGVCYTGIYYTFHHLEACFICLSFVLSCLSCIGPSSGNHTTNFELLTLNSFAEFVDQYNQHLT